MKKFISCDWGLSSFRLRVVDTADLKIIAEERSDIGVAKTFELWRQQNADEPQRLAFYLDVIRQAVKVMEKRGGLHFAGLPLIISGMASSSIGMINLSYKTFPFAANGSDLITHLLKDDHEFFEKIIIVSGVATDDDVVRGEETQLVGSFLPTDKNQVFVFPGTHSKHIFTSDNHAVKVNTYMTGEFFELLSKVSVLSVSVAKESELQHNENRHSFEMGVRDSAGSNLLQNCFKVRTNDLFNKFSKTENYYYLSGLLIGTELMQLVQSGGSNVTLVADHLLGPLYETAFKAMNQNKSELQIKNADDSLVAGQFQILKRFL